MSYQALYRRYRSRTFAEVLGQDHVTTALRNAVRDGRVAQGYLFSGPRGTGKTSTARILAKALNCEHPDTANGEPDATCENCVAVEEGRAVDWLHELDAASNNGVDAMRDLLGRVGMGTSGHRKVYILDEVHMLSTAAANTLLKTLEEPPDHVVFVLATTEPEKVLPTIRSRTQHFEFHLLPAEVLAGHVRNIIDDADLGLGEDAVEHVVQAGRGSARDTLSALDQVAAAGGVADTALPIEDLVAALAAKDPAAVLLAVDAAIRSGREPRTLGAAMIDALRHAFLTAMGAPAGGLTEAATAQAQTVADALGPASVTRALELIGVAMVDMRVAPDPRIPLEVALIQVATPSVGGGDAAAQIRALSARVEQLERALAGGAAPAIPPTGASTTAPTDTAGATETSPTAASPSVSTGAESPAPPAAGGAHAARAALEARQSTGGEAGQPKDVPAATGGSGRPTLGSVRRQRAEEVPPPPTAATPPQNVTAEAAESRNPQSGESPSGESPSGESPAPAAAPSASTPTDASPGSIPASAASGGSARASSGASVPPPATSSGDKRAGAPDASALQTAWDGAVLDMLKGRAKATFRAGRFVDGDGRRARFALPNEATVTACEPKLDEVMAALAAHFGHPVPVELVVDDATRAPSASAARPSGAAVTATPEQTDEDLPDDIDVHDLADATDAAVGGLEQLKEIFPGAEILEDS